MLISVEEAAAVLGLKSRGSIYRKIKSGELPSVREGSGQMIEREGLEQLWGRITRLKPNHPPGDPSAPPPSRRPRLRHSQPAPPPPPPQAPEELPDYNISRARSEYEKANLLELQRKTQERLLLRREEVELAWGQAVNITRTRLLGVASAAKQRIPHLEPEEVELITMLVREALDELAAGEVKA